jgi:hypothetical protein
VVDAPEVRFEEYRLPQSCGIRDYSTRYAVAIDDWANEGQGAIVLLDMDAGASQTVLSAPINVGEGLVAITARCSDQWLAWEEFHGDEQNDRWNVEWKLYAAAISADGLAIGEPVLVAESVTSIRSRPLFQVEDDRLYWMTNSSPNPEQEGAIRASHVEVCDLSTGEKDELVVRNGNMRTFCVQDDELVMSIYCDDEGWQEEVVVAGLDDGAERYRAELGNGDAQVSHWPAYYRGDLLWGELYSVTRFNPRLKLLTRSGDRYLLAEAGSDPCFVGSSVVYESFTTGAPSGLQWPAINVLNLETGTGYELVRSSGSSWAIAWMMPPGQPHSESVLVLTGTVWGEEGTAGVGSWVRRYHL